MRVAIQPAGAGRIRNRMTSDADFQRKATSFDVARRAGVHRSSVSRAFTPGASVSQDTRAKVLQAAEELGYRVNHLAKSLLSQRSDRVGLIVADWDALAGILIAQDAGALVLAPPLDRLAAAGGPVLAGNAFVVEQLSFLPTDGLVSPWTN